MSRKLSRRQFVAATAVSSAMLVAAPYVRGAYAAGKLKIGFWDHWVPGANKTSTDGLKRKRSRFRSTTSRARAISS
jgi:hypothetical protein